jgi:hypothetical protein
MASVLSATASEALGACLGSATTCDPFEIEACVASLFP